MKRLVLAVGAALLALLVVAAVAGAVANWKYAVALHAHIHRVFPKADHIAVTCHREISTPTFSWRSCKGRRHTVYCHYETCVRLWRHASFIVIYHRNGRYFSTHRGTQWRVGYNR